MSAEYFFQALEASGYGNLAGNLAFLGTVYDFRALLFGFLLLMTLDLVLRGIAMWRAARMRMGFWFFVLLTIHSLGILPLLFLGFTKARYRRVGGTPETSRLT